MHTHRRSQAEKCSSDEASSTNDCFWRDKSISLLRVKKSLFSFIISTLFLFYFLTSLKFSSETLSSFRAEDSSKSPAMIRKQLHMCIFVTMVTFLSTMFSSCSGEYAPIPAEPILKALPQCKDTRPLGLSSGIIKDWQITSSSVLPKDKNCQESYGRVYQPDKRGWCAKYKSTSEWLQVDLGFITKVTGVMTQGRCGEDEWIENFSISHSIDSINWMYVERDGIQKVFEGNSDSCSVKHSYLDKAIHTRYIKIHISKFHKHPSLRAEFIGCQVCNKPVGLPPSGRIMASSERPNTDHDTCQAHHGYLLTNKAWCPKRNNAKQWLQYDIGPPSLVTAIVTMGRGEEGRQHWVTKYTLSFSNDSIHWQTYKNPDNNQETTIFTGNQNRNTEHINYLNNPIVARYFRFHPIEWHRGIAMRIGLLGCPYEGACPEGFMRINEDTPCVENLAYKKNLWVSSREIQRKRHVRHQWAKAVPLMPASPIILGHPDKNSSEENTSPSVSSCVMLENYEVTRPIWLVDLKRKATVSGVIIKTPMSVAKNKEEEMEYRVYMHDLDKLVIYLDDHNSKGQISTPEVICGVVKSTNDALFKPKIHVSCSKPIRARYVYVEAWGLENRDGRLFTATLCDVEIYE